MPKIPDIIEEIPMDKLYIVIDKTYELVNKKVKNKLNVMDINSINEFIILCKKEIIDKIGKIV